MKHPSARIMMLGMMIFMSSIFVYASQPTDSLLIQRVWEYGRKLPVFYSDSTSNSYMRYVIDARRRNPILFLVPSMYVVAKGERRYIGEVYGKLNIDKDGHFKMKRQVVSGTIPRNRSVMPTTLEYLTPDLYGKTIYDQRLLSPFHRSNRHFYRFTTHHVSNNMFRIDFRPRLNNTQLVTGNAIVDQRTGRIHLASFKGEYDMIAFRVQVIPNTDERELRLPQWCSTEAHLGFIGNSIDARFIATYNAPKEVADTIHIQADRKMMDTLRTTPLGKLENEIYAHYHSMRSKTDSIGQDTIKRSKWKEWAVDVIGDQLISSMSLNAGGASIKASPLFNPLYLSYSQSRGLAYKMKISMQYAWNAHRYLTFTPRLGYNFKIKQFYFTAPLRMTYNPKRDGYAEVIWANGNRITNSSVIDKINNRSQAATDEQLSELQYFNDNNLKMVNNIGITDWFEVTAGLIYHQRTAVNKKMMQEAGHSVTYRSFSPLLTLQFTPWKKGPILTANYERSIRNVLRSNLEYERWEFDATYQKRMDCMRLLNVRFGGGFYTNQKTSYFVDYANFRDENLPNGWDDDWTGQFQLLSRNWYNASDYYLRGHVSYESPLLMLSWMPWIGRYIETERIYLSTLSIEHTRPYTEIGYGFTTRFVSIGLFASFLKTQYQEIGCKFTFELFRKW
ncbi:DUF5686 family protein [Prevotella sp. P5-126]|uniref:DUF5686 family protein n=1 Tax=Prevotella sp. P5-126 TaxID=2024216 RepID=UPI00117E289B|nr:DUF5686 family protein [Prevotella sp. P5-126]